MRDLQKVSKINIRRLAGDIAAASTSNGRRIDPDAFARRLWKETRRCLLCRKPTYVFGLYLPDGDADPVVRTGLAPHQARFLFYGLCVKCFQEEDVVGRVEDRVADSFLEEANTRAALDAAGARYTSESTPDGSRWIALKGRRGTA
jgi:hypothetical protein